MPDLKSELQKVVEENPSLRKPLVERVWTWLKDHPEKTAKHIAQTLHEDSDAISRALYDLTLRGMVKGVKGRIKKLEWSVIKPLDGTYVLLPRQPRPPKDKTEALSSRKQAFEGIGKAFAVTQLTKNGAKPPEVEAETAQSLKLQELPATVEQEAEGIVAPMTLDLAYHVYLRLQTYFDRKVL